MSMNGSDHSSLVTHLEFDCATVRTRNGNTLALSEVQIGGRRGIAHVGLRENFEWVRRAKYLVI